VPKFKNPVISVGGRRFERIPIKTHVLTEKDDFAHVLLKYARPVAWPGDIVFISETALAITQGRAIHYKTIRVSLLARLLAKGVTKNKYGVGLQSPYAMQVAIREVGAFRLLLGAVVSAFCKFILRRHGDFYEVAGLATKMIDAEHTMGIEQYYDYVIPGPARPADTIHKLATETHLDLCVVDVNDIQKPWCIASSFDHETERLVEKALVDNPLGQGGQCTPMGIIRELK